MKKYIKNMYPFLAIFTTVIAMVWAAAITNHLLNVNVWWYFPTMMTSVLGSAGILIFIWSSLYEVLD